MLSLNSEINQMTSTGKQNCIFTIFNDQTTKKYEHEKIPPSKLRFLCWPI